MTVVIQLSDNAAALCQNSGKFPFFSAKKAGLPARFISGHKVK
jgi:hypothetical protein